MNEVSETPKGPPAQVVDVRGLWCPEPAVRAKDALMKTEVGEVIEVWSTDPLAPVDLQVLCDRLGYVLVAHQDADDHVVTTIQKT